jgi:hypothetical protein
LKMPTPVSIDNLPIPKIFNSVVNDESREIVNSLIRPCPCPT